VESTLRSATHAPSDEQIQHEVWDELKWHARLQPNEIAVSVQDGIVTLGGWVDSYARSWAAEEAALRVRGVKAVVNEIEVRLPGSARRTDPDIVAAAIDALEWDALIPSESVKVTVSNGWVTLAGEVERRYQRTDAERVVRRLTGVRGVTNRITVQPAQTRSDQLQQLIEDAFVRNAQIDAERIQIRMRDSTAILRGSAPSWSGAQAAEQVAWSAPGVNAVENHIKIKL
jgi:osmotically-inducible protein OsmY